MVTMAPRSSNILSNLGIAVISLDFSSVTTCPNTKFASVTHALTVWRAFLPFVFDPLAREVLPSIATILFLIGMFKTFTQLMKHSVNASGLIAMKTLRKVSCEGMPLGNSRNFLSQAILERPNSSIAVKALAPERVAHTAMKRRSPSLCNCVRCRRGSSIVAKWLKKDADGMAADMLLLLHEREGSFRSGKNCSRVPCQNQDPSK